MTTLQNGLSIGDTCFYDGVLKCVVKILSIDNTLTKNVLVRQVGTGEEFYVFGYRLITLEEGKLEIAAMIHDLEALLNGIELLGGK